MFFYNVVTLFYFLFRFNFQGNDKYKMVLNSPKSDKYIHQQILTSDSYVNLPTDQEELRVMIIATETFSWLCCYLGFAIAIWELN